MSDRGTRGDSSRRPAEDPSEPPRVELRGVLPMSASTTSAPEQASAHPLARGAKGTAANAAAGSSRMDGSWAREFGATNVGMTPQAAAADGDVVYLGGDFTGPMAGMPEGTFNRIARWDGVAWQAMGRGLDGTVRAIAIAGDDVYVGGEFTVAGGTVPAGRLARWDGSAWSAVGGGVSHTSTPSLATVRALAWDGGRLYVAGTFDTVGSGPNALSASGVAAFSPETGTWDALGEGLRFLDAPAEGRALLVVGGRVFVGGYFDRAGPVETGSLASIDTATGRWSGYGAGIRSGDFVGAVESLAADASTGTVYVGGSFTAADEVTTSGVAVLRGERFGTLGPFTRFGDASTAAVLALAFADGRLHAGGEFTTAGNAAAAHWAVFDGTAWATPGDGLDNVVRALAPSRGGMVVAGDFAFSGPLRVTHAGLWSGAEWQSFGQGLSYSPYADANVFAVVPLETGAWVGGYFDQAGAVAVGSVARWSGERWDAMAGGVRGVDALGHVYAMTRLGDELYVSGSFASAGGGSAANIARWDGSGWSALGSGLNDTGYALAVLGERLYVGGRFSAAGDTAANGVAVWDPATGAWSALGNAPAYDAAVLGLAVIAERYLVIGGRYDAFRRGGVDLVRGLNGLSIYDTAAEVDPADPLSGYLLLAGVRKSGGAGTVRALQVLGDTLYVGGTFDTAGALPLAAPPQPGFAASNLAAWHFSTDGSWSTPGGTDEPVMALTTPDGATLVVGGWFGSAGPIAASGVAVYDPATAGWAAYGSGVGPGERGLRRVEALAHDPRSGLWAGGTFNTAGDEPGCSIALWRGAIDIGLTNAGTR